MIDQAKRNTLKKVAGIGAGTMAMVATPAIVGVAQAIADTSAATSRINDGDLADIEVRTTVSSVSNDIEIVLTNTGSAPVCITDMTPAEIHTARGKFDFNALLENGSLELASGENITVPLLHHAVDVSNSSQMSPAMAGNLKQKLMNTVSIVTDGDSLAAVTIV